ncbi:MAG: glycolate oxidase subunit GlcE [Thiotrichaceae bacterium]
MNISAIQQTVKTAFTQQTTLQLIGGNSKKFYGREISGAVLNISEYQGILNYEPSELVITARAGTPLSEIIATLAEKNQCLAFEPPIFSTTATLGGTIATGFSGPARPYLGAARDFVLGVKCLNGKGEVLNFGGQVMKNVAGYDVSRLMVGALGTLGVLLEISCKVLPLPCETETIRLPVESEAQALALFLKYTRENFPMTASCFKDNTVYLRFAGANLTAVRNKITGVTAEGEQFWQQLRDHQLDFFQTNQPIWRLSVPATTPPLLLKGESLIEWGGALRWLRSRLSAQTIRETVAAVGGHAILFKGGDRQGEIFHPLPRNLEMLHQRLKYQFDPHNILNRNKMYATW